MFTCFKMA